MSKSVFSLEKDSQSCNYDYKAEYDEFFAKHKGDDVDVESPPLFDGKITSQKRKKISECIENMRKSSKEEDMYKALANALTYASVVVANHRNDKTCLAFIPNPRSRMKSMPGGVEIDLPDIIAISIARSKASHAIDNFPEVPSSFGIESTVEAKLSVDKYAYDQSLRRLFSLSRHHPASFLRHALVANKSHFRLITRALDDQYWWPTVKWTEKNWLRLLCSYIQIIAQEARREVPLSIPTLWRVLEQQTKPIGIFESQLGTLNFRLLPTFCGRGNGRKQFVALGMSTRGKVMRVLKYASYRKEQFDREYELLLKLKDAPGVVRIDENLSQREIDSNICNLPGIELEEDRIRRRSLLALETLGYPLCACESVQEFLEAMYDLLEVLRFITQEKKILHRDVSWSNVLVRPQEYGAPIDVKATIGGGQTTSLSTGHKYRFISDVLGEEEFKIRVALADFDHAVDLDSTDRNELKNATGTPMFMAQDVLTVRTSLAMVGFSVVASAVRKNALDTVGDKYADPEERQEWDDFYRNFSDLQWRITPDVENDKLLESSFRHGAVHDAESVFYLCLLFFNRMWPFNERIDGSELSALEAGRGKLFGALAKRNSSVYGLPQLEPAGFGTEVRLRPFYDMLSAMFIYLGIPWYNVVMTERGERYEFHLHDFMQRLLLQEIVRLRNLKDPIPIEQIPVGVRTAAQRSGDTYSTICSQMLALSIRPRTSTDSESHVVPVSSPKMVPEYYKGIFPEHFWDVYWAKKRERLWLVADRLYKSPDHKEK